MPKPEIQTEPPWEIPTFDTLKAVGVPSQFDKQFRLSRRSLRRICLVPMNMQDRKGKPVGQIQKFTIVNDDDSPPTYSASILARLIYYRAAEFAIDAERVVQFLVHLYGTTALEKEWSRQCRVTIDPDDLSDAFEHMFGDDEEGDDETPSDPDDDDEEGDDEEGDENEYDDEETQPEPSAAARAVPRTSQGEKGEIVERGSRLPASVQVSPAVAEAQRMGLPMQGTPIQVNPDFIVQIISESQSAAVQFFKAAGQENRRILRTMRRECTALAREARRTMKAVTDDALEQRRIANSHAEKLGQQLIDTTELNASHYENFQKIAQQGWTAFRHSMETEMAQFERMREYERTIYGERIARAEEAAAVPIGPSAGWGVVNRAIPAALGIAASVMAEKGNTGMANLLGNLANLLMPKPSLDEDDYDDEDDEEYDDEPPRRRARRASGNGHAAPPAAETAAPPPSSPPPAKDDTTRPAPTRDGTRDLFQSLTPDQVIKLREKMPRGAWEAFEDAANARSESTAKAAVARLDSLVRNDQVAQASVLSILKPEQSAKLFEMIQKPHRRATPPRPTASASPG